MPVVFEENSPSFLREDEKKSPCISFHGNKNITEKELMNFLQGFTINCEQSFYLLGKLQI